MFAGVLFQKDSCLVVLRIVHTVLCFWNHNLPKGVSLFSTLESISMRIYQIRHTPRKKMFIDRYKYNTLERADLVGGEVCARWDRVGRGRTVWRRRQSDDRVLYRCAGTHYMHSHRMLRVPLGNRSCNRARSASSVTSKWRELISLFSFKV
jgi:hypothetical protein